MAKIDKRIADPEIIRWYKIYPRFPGVSLCVELLHRNNLNGAWIDQILYELKEHAQDTFDELISAFRSETHPWVRMMLLSVMGEARLPIFQPVFQEQLDSNEEDLIRYAIWGLEGLDTKEARTALWEYRNRTDRVS